MQNDHSIDVGVDDIKGPVHRLMDQPLLCLYIYDYCSPDKQMRGWRTQKFHRLNLA